MSKLTIPDLLRRTWGLSSTRPALAALAVLVALNLLSSFGQYYYVVQLDGGPVSSYAQFTLALSLVLLIATFAIIIALSRRLLPDGGVSYPPRWLRSIVLLAIYLVAIRIFTTLVPVLMIISGSVDYIVHVGSFVTLLLRFLLLPLFVRVALLAGGEGEPRLASVWSRLWGEQRVLAIGYLALLLAFGALQMLLTEVWPVTGYGLGDQLASGTMSVIAAIGQIVAIICAIAIAQALSNPSAQEVEVFS